MSTFEGKVAVVTGAAGGMGRATAVAFAAAGASVVAADIDAASGEETAALAVAAGGKATFVRTDVSSQADVEAMIDAAVTGFGGLHCAINAAAIENETVRLDELPVEDFDRIIAVNLRSVFLCMKYEIAAMRRGEGGGVGGAIVNIASTNAFRPQHNQAAYTASKHGVLGLTRSAGIDYAADGIRVNAICPGGIDTPMLRRAMEARHRDPAEVAGRLSPLGRFGEADEIARAALWLCSPESSFTVGHALAVDGGYLAS